MAQPAEAHPPPGFLMALWLAFLRFITCCFRSPSSPAAAALPTPVTAKQRSTSSAAAQASLRLSHFPSGARVKHPTPLKRPPSAAGPNSPAGSAKARTSSPSPSLSLSPKGPSPSNPEHVFHPAPTSFPNISWSGIFASPSLPASPSVVSEIELGRISTATPPDTQPPGSPSLFPASHASSTSFHSIRSPSPRTPTTPSSAVMARLDRSSVLSPTTISDGSFQIISPGDHHGFTGSPVTIPGSYPLPSPWSPAGTATPLDVWMSVDGLLMNAIGPVDDNSALSRDSSLALMATMLTGSRISSINLYSSPSALDAFGISVYINVDDVADALSSNGNTADTPDDPTNVSKLSQVPDEDLVAQEPHIPHERQESVLSITKSHAINFNARRLSSPPTKPDNVEMNHVNSASSISSIAYEFQLGLFGDGRSMTAIDHIISLLDQASPESLPPHKDAAVQPVEPG